MDYKFEVLDSYFYATYLSRVLDFDRLIGWVDGFISHPGFRSGTHVLWDATAIEEVAFGFGEMQSFGEYLLTKRSHRGGGRSAFVTKNDLVFGMFRTHEMLNQDKFDYDYRVLRDVDSAREWILDGIAGSG